MNLNYSKQVHKHDHRKLKIIYHLEIRVTYKEHG